VVACLIVPIYLREKHAELMEGKGRSFVQVKKDGGTYCNN